MRKLLSLAGIAVLAVQLAACGLTAKDVYNIRASYDAAVLAPAARYRATCDAAPTAKCKANVVQLQKADQVASNAIGAAVTFVRSHPTSNATAYVAAATAAVAVATNLIAVYGAK